MAESIQTVMTRDPVCMDADASLADAAKAMDERNVGDVLVLEEGSLCGIVTDRDIAIRAVARGADPTTTRLGDICSRDLVTLSPSDAVDDAIARMREHAVRRMPVLDEGRPVGIVSLGDLAEERDRRSVLGEISASPANHQEGGEPEMIARIVRWLPKSTRRSLQEQARRGRQRGGEAGHALEDRNRQQLYDIAKKEGIPGRSKMGKWELINAIRERR